MTCGKTLDGAYDIEADTLTVNESSDLRGFTTVDGPSTFTQDLDLQNPTTLNTITLSASSAVQDYTLTLPPQQGTSGQFFTTDGLGNAAWSSVSPTVGGVSYIAISAPDNFMKVNGLNSDSTYTNKTFNLELSGTLPTEFGGTGLSTIGAVNQILSSTGAVLQWKSSSGSGLNLLQSSPVLITPSVNTSLTFDSASRSRKLVLISVSPDDNQFFGLGGSTTDGFYTGGVLRYQVATTQSAHIFYAGVSPVSSTTLFKIDGNGNTTTTGSSTINSLTASRLVLTNSSKTLVSLSAGTAGQVLTFDGSSITWGTPLTYNTQHFNISGNQLNHRFSSPFTYTDSGLELKLKKTTSILGFELNKLYITADGELDLNLQDLIYPSAGLRKVPLLEEALGLGVDLTGLGGVPDVTILGLDIDSDVLDFKSNKLSIKSLGQSRVPYYNAFKLVSESTFLYNDSLNQLSVNRVLLNDTVDLNSDNRRATTKAYVDNLNTFESDSGLVYTQAAGDSTRIWTIRLNSTFLGVDEDNNLITKITGAEGKCITVNPDNNILLTYNNKHFGETVGGANAGALFSKLETTTGSCIVLDPDYKLDLGIKTDHFSVVEGQLTSKLTNVAGNCVLIDPDYKLYLDFNTEHFSLVGGKLTSKLSSKVGNCILLNTEREVYLKFKSTHFKVDIDNSFEIDLDSTGAIVVKTGFGLTVDVNTTYLEISANQITLASTIVTKINKIATLETELNTTKGKVTTAEGNITTLQGKITTAEGTITSHSGTLTTHTGQITALQGQIGGAIGAGVGGGIVGAGAGIAGGVLGGAGSAVSGVGSAVLAGLAGAGGALLGVGVGILISEDPEPDADGNTTYSFEIEKLLTESRLVVTDSSKNLASLGLGTIGQILTRNTLVAPQAVTSASGDGTVVTLTVTGGIDTFPIGSEVYVAEFGESLPTGVKTVIGGSSTIIQFSSVVTTFTTLGTVETLGMKWASPETSGNY